MTGMRLAGHAASPQGVGSARPTGAPRTDAEPSSIARRSVTLRVQVRASIDACRAAVLLDGREVAQLSATERLVDVAALGERRTIRAVEAREPDAIVYRWVTPGLPFVEERFGLAALDERTSEVVYRARRDPPVGLGERIRSALLTMRLRRSARMRLEGLRALVESPVPAALMQRRRRPTGPAPAQTLPFGSVVLQSESRRDGVASPDGPQR